VVARSAGIALVAVLAAGCPGAGSGTGPDAGTARGAAASAATVTASAGPARAKFAPPAALPEHASCDHDHGEDPCEGTEVGEALRVLESDTRVEMRVYAAGFLGGAGGPDVSAAVIARVVMAVTLALGDQDPRVRAAAGDAVARLAAEAPARRMLEALPLDDRPEVRVFGAVALARAGDRRGIGALTAALADRGVPSYLQSEAIEALRPLAAGASRGYVPGATLEANREAIAAWKAWWAESETRLRWDEGAKGFRPPADPR